MEKRLLRALRGASGTIPHQGSNREPVLKLKQNFIQTQYSVIKITVSVQQFY